MATLNITYNGLSADFAVDFDQRFTDHDVKRVALELVRSGGTAGLHLPHLADSAFDSFVVDRLQNGERIYLRPKVPFGAA
jgi:hypothetical protein